MLHSLPTWDKVRCRLLDIFSSGFYHLCIRRLSYDFNFCSTHNLAIKGNRMKSFCVVVSFHLASIRIKAKRGSHVNESIC